jgi:hypothetical protein
MTAQDDLFTTRIKLDPSDREASVLIKWVSREGAITYILKEIEESGLALPGVVFCKAIIEKFHGECVQERAKLAYRIASRHGIKLHEVTGILTEHTGESMFLVVLQEGEAP